MVKKNKRELRHQGRQYSIKEGIFASIKSSFGDYYTSPFAIATKMSNPFIMMMSAITGILGPLTQTFGSRLMEKYSRKKIVVKAVFLEALIWLPMITLAILFYKNIFTEIIPLSILLIFSIYIIIGNIAIPVWFSWMGDLVDEKYRGQWFSLHLYLLLSPKLNPVLLSYLL